RERSHSEQTAREIDEEVKHIVDEAIEKVRHILELRRKSLEALAKRLIEAEVIDAVELKQIIDANSSSPLIVPGTVTAPRRLAPPTEQPPAGELGQADA
ncbi:MAG: ATP-binding protein, partial [Pirellulales bacterium]